MAYPQTKDKPKLHCILHAPFETIGIAEPWAFERGIELHYICAFKGDKFPHPDKVQALISMGGPQTAFDLGEIPYLATEVALMKRLLAKETPILGFCLGGQLLSIAAGAAVEKSPEVEIGIFPIELNTAGQRDPFCEGWPKKFSVLHWHEDMMGLPKGAEVLAKSQACPRQIIRFSKQAIGLQCHMEVNRMRAYDLMRNCMDQFKLQGKYIQKPEDIMNWNYTSMNQWITEALDHFFLPALFQTEVKSK